MSADYSAYLRSSHWRRLRRRYRDERDWTCGICQGADRLELHHKTYERVGCERLDDLIPLCQACHSLLHQLVTEGQATLDPRSAFKRSRPRPRPRKSEDRTAEIEERNALTRERLRAERAAKCALRDDDHRPFSKRLRAAVIAYEQGQREAAA